jgi:DhnA-type fructose-1,6-bisphosphate aldolase and related enzymes
MAGNMKVVMSGGSKADDLEFLRTVESAIDGGASGLAVGRNVFQREDPVAILDALEKVVFEELSAEEALSGTSSAEPLD